MLEVSEEVQASRSNWGSERFERTELQKKVASNLRQLMDESWVIVDGNLEADKVQEKLLALALDAIDNAKEKNLGKLYENKTL